MKINKELLSKRITKCRKNSGMTQSELAKCLNVQRQVISYYENSTRTPNIEDLATMADLFNTTTDYLLGLTDIECVDLNLKEFCEFVNLNTSAVNNLHFVSTGIKSREFFLRDKMSPEHSFDFLNFFFGGYNNFSGFALCREISDLKNILITQSSEFEKLSEHYLNMRTENTTAHQYVTEITTAHLTETEIEDRFCFAKFKTIEMFKKMLSEYLKDELYSYQISKDSYEIALKKYKDGVQTNANNNETE